jgi:hypothetical protein
MYFTLPNIVILIYIQKLTEVVLPPVQNIVEIYKQTTFIFLYPSSYGSETRLFPLIYVSTQVSIILLLTLCFELINLPFRKSLVPEIRVSIMSYHGTHAASVNNNLQDSR